MNDDPLALRFMSASSEAFALARQHAQRYGFTNLSSYESCAVVAELFLGMKSAGDRDEARRKIEEIIWSVGELISATRPQHFREALAAVIADLKSISDACARGPSDAGRPRHIRADALVSLTGILPKSLRPPQWDGVNFSNFGQQLIGPLGSVKKDEGVTRSLSPLDPDQPATDQDQTAEDNLEGTREGQLKVDLIPIDFNSLLSPGILNLLSTRDELTTVWPSRSESTWPTCLSDLGYLDGLPPDGISSRRIQALQGDQKKELAALANGASRWLRLCFGIQTETDPLSFSEIRLIAPAATALILKCLTEIACPAWPEQFEPRQVLTRLIDPCPESDEWHADLQGSFYQTVVNLIWRRTTLDPKAFNKRANWIGLINHDDSDVFDRYAGRYVRLFAQVRVLNAARLWINDLLKEHGIDLADFGKVVGGTDGISPEDWHDLGRWSDALKAQMKLGVVDDTRGVTVRFQLGVHPWKFPKISSHSPIDQVSRSLVNVVQDSRLSRLAPHDDALRTYICESDGRSLEEIHTWYIEKCDVKVGMGALLDRLQRIGLSGRILSKRKVRTPEQN